MSEAAAEPDLPADRWLPTLLPGGPLELPGRGTTFVRHHPAPDGAPTVLLLHGIGVTADANWFPTYPVLSERYGVVAIDHRGHGRGIRADRAVRLADCADDAAAALEVLGIDRAIVVGYSMGGPIAQLVWHRHPGQVAGLVLCATAHRFRGIEPVRDIGPSLLQRLRATTTAPARRGRLDPALRRWLQSELALTDRRRAVQAGFSLARYDASRWIGRVDVPHAVVVTTRDAAVSPARQKRLVAALPNPSVHDAAIDHTGCVTRPAVFVPELLAAVEAVARAPRSPSTAR
ncbi:MAG: alpha/beta fold hydrolase [Acidimicrobiales bacterium]